MLAAAKPTSRNGLGRVVHPIGEGHEAVGRIRLGEGATSLTDLLGGPTALLAAVPAAYLAYTLVVAAQAPSTPTERGIRTPAHDARGASPRILLRLLALVAVCAAISVELLGVG